MIRGYAEVRDCSREYLLNYFGKELDYPCGYCNNREADLVVKEDVGDAPFPINSRVAHRKWGRGWSNATRAVIRWLSSSTKSGTRLWGKTS